MNRIDRLTGTLLLLQSRRGIDVEQIAAHWEISVRTVYRDLAALGEAGVPVAMQPSGGYGLMDGYHVPPIMLTEDEASALFVSGEITDRIADNSLRRSLDSALLKVKSVLPEERRDYLSRLKQSIDVRISPFGEPPTSSEFIPCQDAVLRRRCIALHYDAAGRGEISSRIVEPLGLIYYSSRWHLIAYCRLREDFRDFRLDRIAETRVLDESFDGHTDFTMERFFESKINLGDLVPVTLLVDHCSLDRLRRGLPGVLIREEPLEDDRVRVVMLVYSLKWLTGWLLGFGAGVFAESPDKLQAMLQYAAREIADKYSAFSGRH